jgi:membrane protease YdiL (CAAX protease family)
MSTTRPQHCQDCGMSTRARFVIALSVALVAYNAVVQLVPAYDALYVPLNLAATAVVVLTASRHGLGATDLALKRETAWSGFVWGGAIAGGAALLLGIAAAVPALHWLLDDARVAGIGTAALLYRIFVRIPLGTVLLEEVAFRGALFGAWARRRGVTHAAIGSSIVFGLWHVRPAIDLLSKNELAESLAAPIPAVAALVAFSAGAGILLCLLRIRSRSLVAPMVAHAAVNSLATLAAFAVQSS